MKVPLHSPRDARLAALFVAHIFPICSVLSPGQPGASPVSVRRATFTTDCYAVLMIVAFRNSAVGQPWDTALACPGWPFASPNVAPSQ